ncbi:hypothetical protein [Methanothermococcus sp.]|uniref:hypothetical protein n=1 Tax=Methanothermococcus sp. TaxID=2614238 RepID=UPI0025F7B8C8|nr:hypothetical protein [Methanothermococcus sp.]
MNYPIHYNLLGINGLIFGILYIISGIIEFISSIGVNLPDNLFTKLFTGDLFGSIALLTIGVIYTIGFKKSLDKEYNAVSYIYTASLLGLGIALIVILTICSHAIGFLTGVEDYIEWNILEDISIYLILGILSSITYYISIKNIPKSAISTNLTKNI